MKAVECTRAWQAEAALDGRLSDVDARSFERHAVTCEVCARQVRALAMLAETAARLPVLSSTPLERRRLRNELLRSVNEEALSPARATRLGRFVLVAILLGVLGAFVVLWRLHGPEAAEAPVVPTFRITTSPGAEWRTVERGPTLRLSVARGRIALSVDKLRPGQRFLLDLPDGELAVRGTRFVVDVDGGRTMAVSVSEGHVSFRLRDGVLRELLAGDHWSEVPVSVPSAAATAAPVGGTSKVGVAEPGPLRARVPRRPASIEQAVAQASNDVPEMPPATPASAIGKDFNLAMSAFSAGDYGRAEGLFETFERAHPADARVEDAMFLRAVARSRRGDSSGAANIARAFLRRYPDALRRADAERLSGSSDSH